MRGMRDVDIWIMENVLPHETSMLAVARRVLGTQDAAKDLVQDVIMELLTDERWRMITRAKPYLMRMVYSRSVDVLRQRKVLPMQAFPTFESLIMADSKPDAFTVVSDREQMSQVLAAIESMPPQRKKAFVLCRIEGLSPSDAGKALGLSASGVRSHISRSLLHLTKLTGSFVSENAETEAEVDTAQVAERD